MDTQTPFQKFIFESWCVVLSIILALTFGGLVLLYMGESPLEIYILLVEGALGSAHRIDATLLTTTPYLFCGLALALSFRAGLFNVGAEGQLFAGAMSGALAGHFLNIGALAPIQLPLVGMISPLLLIVILSSFLGGLLWSYLPIVLKIRFEVHEVISTIMLNYIMYALCAFLVRQPSIRVDNSVPRTTDIAAHAQLGGFGIGSVQIFYGLLFGVVIALLLMHLFQKTRFGFELSAVGLQPDAAENAGISVNKVYLYSFLISGGLAGLAGGFFVLSPEHPHFEMGFSPGWGFWGIALALLARNHPVGVIFAALLFGVFETGSGLLDTTRGIPRELIQILEALIILIVSSRLFQRLLRPKNS